MSPSRKVNSKKQSAGKRRSGKLKKSFKTKRCLIRVKRLKTNKLNMRKVNLVEQRKDFSNKKVQPLAKKAEIRIIKAVSNVTKQIGKDSEKIKGSTSIVKQKSIELPPTDNASRVLLSKIKSTPLQNLKYSQKVMGKLPSDVRNNKKLDLQPYDKSISKKKIEIKVEETPTRSKRTPKPNRKYLNDNLITSFKSGKILPKVNDLNHISDSESESDKLNASSSDVDSDILRESDDSSTPEDDYDKPKTKTKVTNITSGGKRATNISPNVTSFSKKSTNISPVMKAKLINNTMEKNRINQFSKLNQGNKNIPLMKQVAIPGKTIILNKFSYNQSNNQPLFQKNQLSKAAVERSQKIKQILSTSGDLKLIRKRKLNEPIQQREIIKIPKITEKSILRNDFDSDIELNDVDDDDDANNTDIEDFIKELTGQKQIKVLKKFPQINKQSTIPGIRNISNIVKTPTLLNKSLPQPKEKGTESYNENKKEIVQQITKKVLNKSYETENDTAESAGESDKEVSEKDDPFGKSVTSTLEDFEKMPTFTIVNINDIIGKKGDFMIEKMKNDPLKPESVRTSPNHSDENSLSTKNKISSSASSSQRSRRKAVHTNLLSENFDKNKDPPPRTPFPPPRTNNNSSKPTQFKTTMSSANESNIKILNNNLKLSKSVSSSKKGNLNLSNKSSNKGPPRILNSMVAKKTAPITTFSTKVDTRHSNDLSDSDSERITRGKLSKESDVLKNQLFKQISDNKSESKNQPTTNSNKRKLPIEKVIIQRQGNKIIKKMTCFETWYVINLPPEIEKENTTRNVVDIPLIRLANQANTIDLPNNKWTCKVSLQKCSPAMMSQNFEPYTGEIYDDYINPDELHKYRPTNVMFRRQALHPTPKVPYDRAVIFKNNTFFTNIEGKNVRLIGAPHQIEQERDVEILLNLVDEFSLKNQFVEQAPYVP